MINYFWPLSNSTILKFNCLFQWFTTAVGENETSLNSDIISGKGANKYIFMTIKSAAHWDHSVPYHTPPLHCLFGLYFLSVISQYLLSLVSGAMAVN